MSELKIVKVAVENAAFSFDALFDYSVPQSLEAYAQKGCRVLVPFGRANIKKVAMIFEVSSLKSDDAKDKKLKSVTAVLDDAPVLNDEGLSLALWISQNTFCTLFEAVKVQLPTGMNLKISQSYQKNELNEKIVQELTDEQKRLLNEITSQSKPIEHKNCSNALDMLMTEL